MNFKFNNVNKFCRFGSLFVRVVLSNTHNTLSFENLLNFNELYFDGNPMGWDGTDMNCYEMRRNGAEKYVPCVQISLKMFKRNDYR